MKISFCSIAFRKSDKTITEIIPIIADLGYDGIEIWGNHFINTPTADIKAALEEHNLPAAMLSPYLDFTGGPDNLRLSLDIAADFLEKAVELKCPNIRVFTGVVGSAEAGPEQRQAAVKGLQTVCRQAQGTGVTLALETHPKTLVDTVESTLRLLDEVAADNLAVNLDIYHMWEAHRDPLWVLSRLAPYTSHVHAKNADLPPELNGQNPLLHDKHATQEIYGVKPLADGNMNYPEFIKALHDLNFTGYFSIEWFGEKETDAAAAEINYVRRILRGAERATNC